MINAGNMPNKNRPYEATNRGLHRSISAYGIVGKLKDHPSPPPHFNDGKMARFALRAKSSLILGGGGV